MQSICDAYKSAYGVDDNAFCEGKDTTLHRGIARKDVDVDLLDAEIEKYGNKFDRCVRIGLRNVASFFLRAESFRGVNVYVRDAKYICKMFTEEEIKNYGINTDANKYLVLTFLVDVARASENVRARMVNFREGGGQDPANKVYAPGFDEGLLGSEFALGINQIPPHMLLEN